MPPPIVEAVDRQGVELAVPPYDSFVPGATDVVPGTVAVLRGEWTVAALLAAAALTDHWPWLPVVVDSSNAPALGLLARRVLPGVVEFTLGRPLDASTAVRLVRERPIGKADLVEYLARRISDPEQLRLLVAALADEPWRDLNGCKTTYYQSVRRNGLVRLRDWRAVMRLAPFVGSALTAEQIALKLGADPRTLRRSCREMLRTSWSELRAAAGWEWMTERALLYAGARLRAMQQASDSSSRYMR